MPTLFDPVTAGDLHLANRIVMAPLTRDRSPNAIPLPLTATYYTQRASAGLIITEATAITQQGQGFSDVPGLYGTEQLDGWKKVTHDVHAAGGSIENRARLMLEVTCAVTSAVSGGRTGIRLSPATKANDINDADPQPLFDHVVRELASMNLAYIHIIEGDTGGARTLTERPFDYAALKAAYREAGGKGAWMVNNGYDQQMAEKAIKEGHDLVAFGKLYIANPDLVARLKQGGPFNAGNQKTWYGGGADGLTDYPTL